MRCVFMDGTYEEGLITSTHAESSAASTSWIHGAIVFPNEHATNFNALDKALSNILLWALSKCQFSSAC